MRSRGRNHRRPPLRHRRVTQVVLDLTSVKDGKGMTVSDVISDGGPLSSRTTDRLTITLPAPPKAGDRRQTVIYCRRQRPAHREEQVRRVLSSVGTGPIAWRASGCPPSITPSDKATSEFLVTAPARYQVVANGVLVEELDLGDGRRMTHWKQSVPIATWLNNIGVARFSSRHFGAVAGVPLQTWVFPQDRDNGIVTFEEPTRRAMEFFTAHIGPFPYEKLADVQVSEMGGGMGLASAIFYGEKSVSNRPAFGLVAHEISHQWFGDSVTEKSWDDAWLSEGFATYFAALATEFYDGRDAFLASMKRSRTGILAMEKRTPNVAVIHDNLPEIQNGRAPVGIVYQKGGWTLHMLRGVAGTEKFWAGIREYYRRYRDSNASTDDLQPSWKRPPASISAGSSASGYRPGSPSVEGGWKYNESGKR